ncbi:MAG: hypothetical protein PHO95_06635 [Bacteroidales bacterium]|nr:hypothetical protein [Bacteroidales bacterium]
MKKKTFIIFFILLSSINYAQEYLRLLSNFKESDHNKPSLFAPGFISDGLPNRDVAISPKGDEIFYSIYTPDFKYSAIVFTKFKNGYWTVPEVASFSSDSRYKYIEPAFNYDGSILFFSSNMPSGRDGEFSNNDIWAVRRDGEKWGDPYNIGPPINTDGGEYFPSLTRDGSIYFTRNLKNESTSNIFKSEYKDGVYHEPVKLPDEINCGTDRYNAFICPDESFIVIPAEGVEDGVIGSNYYISFNNGKMGWTNPINMGPLFNSNPGRGWSFSTSPDYKYIFFMATRKSECPYRPDPLTVKYFKEVLSEPENGYSDIYWLNSNIINDLKNKELTNNIMANKDIYSTKSEGSIISPFNLKIDLMSQLMLIPFEKDPDKYYNQFEIQQSISPEGLKTLAVIGYQVDGSSDVYFQKNFPLASQSSILNKAKLIETQFSTAQFSFSQFDLDANIVFKDKYGRPIVLKIVEIKREEKNPFTLLAPVGVISKNPQSLPVYYMHQMSFARKNYTDIVISINGNSHKPDLFMLPIDKSSNYFTRYSLETFNVDINPSTESDMSIIDVGSKNHVIVNDIHYDLRRNQGHPEIKKISVHKERQSLSVEFTPAFPDIMSLKDGAYINGTFSVTSYNSSGVINGTYQLNLDGEDFSIKLHPDKGWIPNEKRLIIRLMLKLVKSFKEWPKSYIWNAKIHKVNPGEFKLVSHWERL